MLYTIKEEIIRNGEPETKVVATTYHNKIVAESEFKLKVGSLLSEFAFLIKHVDENGERVPAAHLEWDGEGFCAYHVDDRNLEKVITLNEGGSDI